MPECNSGAEASRNRSGSISTCSPKARTWCWNLREDLPFPDDSIRAIYSEHIFEHFAYPTDAKHLLRESLRVLAPGGTFSLVVPDFGALLRAYACNDHTFFEYDRLRSYLLAEHPTFMHHVNYWFRQDGLHRYAYDAETLLQVLRDAGFEDVRVRDYDPSLDSEKRYRLHSLYMEGVKPAATCYKTIPNGTGRANILTLEPSPDKPVPTLSITTRRCSRRLLRRDEAGMATRSVAHFGRGSLDGGTSPLIRR